jgi:hypothetical protein
MPDVSAMRVMSEEDRFPKYTHPKILLIDVCDEAWALLAQEGYNVSVGTFGKPYRVEKKGAYEPVIAVPNLPNYAEQEIVAIDLALPDPEPGPADEKETPNEDSDWWVKSRVGFVDPRPRVMVGIRKAFDRILRNGGIFIVFAEPRFRQQLVLGSIPSGFRSVSVEEELLYDNWSFLNIFDELDIKSDHGTEITSAATDLIPPGHLTGSTFDCTFAPQNSLKSKWRVLGTNKYAETVAGVIAFRERDGGCVFLLPQLRDKGALLVHLIKNVLPELRPPLFPDAEGQQWVHRPEYELVPVLKKHHAISVIRAEAAERIAALENEIEAVKDSNQFLYDLLRETGTALVAAVQTALAVLGFKSVVDVDAEMKKARKDASLREDLRVHDTSPVLVIDVKGVGGTPADDEALQSQKHAFIYMKENDRTDVKGLTIINHQRHIPPLDRENETPFRQEILHNAEQLGLGLMTTFDLFRLMRGSVQHGWTPDQVKPVFYRTGRISPIPEHYHYVGRIKQVWKKAFSIRLEDELRLNDRVAIEFSVDFEEQDVASLMLNDAKIETATAGSEVGIARDETAARVKPGAPVYRLVRKQCAAD